MLSDSFPNPEQLSANQLLEECSELKSHLDEIEASILVQLPHLDDEKKLSIHSQIEQIIHNTFMKPNETKASVDEVFEKLAAYEKYVLETELVNLQYQEKLQLQSSGKGAIKELHFQYRPELLETVSIFDKILACSVIFKIVVKKNELDDLLDQFGLVKQDDGYYTSINTNRKIQITLSINTHLDCFPRDTCLIRENGDRLVLSVRARNSQPAIDNAIMSDVNYEQIKTFYSSGAGDIMICDDVVFISGGEIQDLLFKYSPKDCRLSQLKNYQSIEQACHVLEQIYHKKVIPLSVPITRKFTVDDYVDDILREAKWDKVLLTDPLPADWYPRYEIKLQEILKQSNQHEAFKIQKNTQHISQEDFSASQEIELPEIHYFLSKVGDMYHQDLYRTFIGVDKLENEMLQAVVPSSLSAAVVLEAEKALIEKKLPHIKIYDLSVPTLGDRLLPYNNMQVEISRNDNGKIERNLFVPWFNHFEDTKRYLTEQLEILRANNAMDRVESVEKILQELDKYSEETLNQPVFEYLEELFQENNDVTTNIIPIPYHLNLWLTYHGAVHCATNEVRAKF